MSIIISTKRNSSIFLATLLVIGTIATILPSAQAEPYYGMDKDRKDVSVSSLKCNNINVNVNGLELDVLPSFLSGELATEAQEGSTDASSFAGNGDGSEINDFRFICINNNNNTVIGGEEPIPPVPPIPPEPLTCEGCFTDILDDEQELDLLEVLSSAGYGDFEGLCDFILSPEISNLEKIEELTQLLSEAGIVGDTSLTVLLCLEDLELIFIPTPMPLE